MIDTRTEIFINVAILFVGELMRDFYNVNASHLKKVFFLPWEVALVCCLVSSPFVSAIECTVS